MKDKRDNKRGKSKKNIEKLKTLLKKSIRIKSNGLYNY